MRWHRLATLLQVVLLAYWVATEVVDLYPLNDLASRPADYDLQASIAVNVLQQLAYMALFAVGLWWTAAAATVGYGVYLGLQLWTWWVPYLTGVAADGADRKLDQFSDTVSVLPVIDGRIGPDLQHLVLQTLTELTVLCSAMAARALRRARTIDLGP
jgi:hypothetical protein